MVENSLCDFRPIFGRVEVEKGSLHEGYGAACSSPPLYPLLFSIAAASATNLRVIVSDFHGETWQTIQTVNDLDALRDDTGVGGTWGDFLQFLHDSFSGGNVRFLLSGFSYQRSAREGASHSGAPAKLVGQKAKMTPKVHFTLKVLEGNRVEEGMAVIAFQLLEGYTTCLHASLMAAEHVNKLKEELEVEKANSEKLQATIEDLKIGRRAHNRQRAARTTSPPSSRQHSPSKNELVAVQPVADSATAMETLDVTQEGKKGTGAIEVLAFVGTQANTGGQLGTQSHNGDDDGSKMADSRLVRGGGKKMRVPKAPPLGRRKIRSRGIVIGSDDDDEDKD